MMTMGRHTNVAATGLVVTARVEIGNFCSVAPDVQFQSRENHSCIDHPDLVATYQLPGYPPMQERNTITIGSDVWIGRGAVLLGGITVGHGAIIGAFSVVAKDVPPYAVMVGNPATMIRYRFPLNQREALLRIAWWEWDDEVIRYNGSDFTDIDWFIREFDT